MICGGALGNIIDRFAFGQVIDFVDFHFWPVFNLADLAIVIGVFLFMIGFIRNFPGKDALEGAAEMHRELISIGAFKVHSYGFMLCVAFILGIIITYRHLKRNFLDPFMVYDIVIAALVGGIIGARIFYILGNLNEFKGHWGMSSSSGTWKGWSSSAACSWVRCW